MRMLLTVILLACGLEASAQITLEEYREAVFTYSWSLKTARARSDEAGWTQRRAQTGYLPALSLDGSFSVNFRRFSGVKPWTFALQPQVVQVLYGGGSVRAAYRQAGLEYDIALCEEAFTRLDVRYAADYAYWNLSAMRLFRDAMEQYVEIIRSLKRIVDRRFEEGYIAKGDVLMIDARLSEAEFEALSAEHNHRVALHNFNILCGIEGDRPAELAQSIVDTIPLPLRATASEAIMRRPDYRAARLRVGSAEQAMRLVRAGFNPHLSVGVSGSWQPDNPNRRGTTSVDGAAFVQLSVPIFHWGERRRAVRSAHAAVMQREWTAAALHDGIVREELDGWSSLIDNEAKIESVARSLRIAGENLEISTYSYGEGLVTILEVLQAQLSWIQLYTNAINARYDYAVSVAAYERLAAY